MNTAFVSAMLVTQMLVGIGTLVMDQPRRAHFIPRLVLALAIIVAVEVVGEMLVPIFSPGGDGILGSLVRFSMTAFSFYVGVRVTYDVSPLQALFCCTAGYAAQNLSISTTELMDLLLSSLGGVVTLSTRAWLVIAPLFIVYPPYLFLFARGARRNDLASERDYEVVLVTTMAILAVTGLDAAIKNIPDGAMEPSTALTLRVAHALICIFVLYGEYKALYSRQLETEREVTRRLMAERERQYSLSRKNIEAINVKCHDIRYQIHHLEGLGDTLDRKALENIAQEVRVYDAMAETGSVALDTILTEKGLVCSNEDIAFTVMADGAALDFMEPSDVYALFGNMLDNAIEAVRKLRERERRAISLSVRRSHSIVVVDVENPCDKPPRFEDGLPVTTRDRTIHGFGTRSMRTIVERYGGTLKLGVDGDIFYVNALLPLPEGQEG